jgi:hypothetical protein
MSMTGKTFRAFVGEAGEKLLTANIPRRLRAAMVSPFGRSGSRLSA